MKNSNIINYLSCFLFMGMLGLSACGHDNEDGSTSPTSSEMGGVYTDDSASLSPGPASPGDDSQGGSMEDTGSVPPPSEGSAGGTTADATATAPQIENPNDTIPPPPTETGGESTATPPSEGSAGGTTADATATAPQIENPNDTIPPPNVSDESGSTAENTDSVITPQTDTSDVASQPLAISEVFLKTSALGSHSCAILKDSSVKCWGKNGQGQLGDGTIENKNISVSVILENGSPLDQVTEVALGKEHTCALLKDESVYCWGLNTSGQVGNGTTLNQSFASQVKDTNGNALIHVKEIAVGLSHSCARLENDSVVCWGAGEPFATQVKEAKQECYDTNAIARDKVFAIQRDCKVSGTGTTEEFEIPLESVQKIEAGYSHTCALLNNNQVKCWGSNVDGQLGTGGNANSKIAVPVMDKEGQMLSNVKEIVLSYKHSCALLNDETVSCWGRRPAGETPFGSTRDFTAFPVMDKNRQSISNVKEIGIGKEFSCTLLKYESVYCWGKNDKGYLGDRTTYNRAYAMPVKDESGLLDSVKEIAVGNEHTCALLNDDTAKCWGYNSYGQVGNGLSSSSTRNSNPVKKEDGNTLNNIKGLSLSIEHTCAILKDASINCWGKNSLGQVGNGNFESKQTKAVQVQ